MKILVLEYFNSGVCEFSSANHLPEEGAIMRDALLEDLQMTAGVEVVLVHNPALPKPRFDTEIKTFDTSYDYMEQLSGFLDSVDAFWPIAPETNRALEQLCKICEHQNKLLINTSSSAVRLTANKNKTIKILHTHNINCVPTAICTLPIPFDGDIVVKPNDGVGCENLSILQANDLNTQLYNKDYIVQPYLSGQAASLSLLCVNGQAQVLAANTQDVAKYGQTCVLEACGVNMLDYDRDKLGHLAQEITDAIPGLAAYVGIDLLVQGDEALVLEINPRLTSSYIGLRCSLGINPAELIIKSLRNGSLPEISSSQYKPVRVNIL